MTDRPSPPTYRFWGSRKPPKDRSEFWAATKAPASTTDGAPSTGAVATLRMYGPIDSWGGWFGISAKDVSAALDELGDDVTEIRVRINSPGGEVWEGLAILNMLRAHKAKVVAVVDGIAASAASVVATGCDETVMSPGTQFMVHDGSGFCLGQAKDMRKMAEALDSVSDSLASIYAESAGGTTAEWRAVMVEETWYTAQETVDAHLADRVAVVADAGKTSTAGDDGEPDLADPGQVEDAFDLSIYAHAGRSKAPAPKPPSASAVGSPPTQEGSPAVAFSDEQVTTMRQKLGITAEDADEATIMAALDEALAERTDPPAALKTPEIPEGHVVIPAAKLADLEAGMATASAVAAKLATQERDKFLDSVRTKYAPTNRAAWEKEYDRDPEGTRTHFATAPELIPTEEIGTGGEPESTDPFVAVSDEALEQFAASFGMSKEALRG